MIEHWKESCKDCNTVISECICFPCDCPKPERIVVCAECKVINHDAKLHYKDGNVRCPYCESMEDGRFMDEHSTISGTRLEPLEIVCLVCKKTYLLYEKVEREWAAEKVEDRPK